jgi:hypothetical protein
VLRGDQCRRWGEQGENSVTMYVMLRIVAGLGGGQRRKISERWRKGCKGEAGFAYREISIAMIGFRICTRIRAIPAICFPHPPPLPLLSGSVAVPMCSLQEQLRVVNTMPGEKHASGRTGSGSSLDRPLALLASFSFIVSLQSCDH